MKVRAQKEKYYQNGLERKENSEQVSQGCPVPAKDQVFPSFRVWCGAFSGLSTHLGFYGHSSPI